MASRRVQYSTSEYLLRVPAKYYLYEYGRVTLYPLQNLLVFILALQTSVAQNPLRFNREKLDSISSARRQRICRCNCLITREYGEEEETILGRGNERGKWAARAASAAAARRFDRFVCPQDDLKGEARAGATRIASTYHLP